jgi:hypothetical protein
VIGLCTNPELVVSPSHIYLRKELVVGVRPAKPLVRVCVVTVTGVPDSRVEIPDVEPANPSPDAAVSLGCTTVTMPDTP